MATKKKTTTKKKAASKQTSAKKTNPKSKKVAAKKGAAKTLTDLFEDGLRDIYWAEKALSKALPRMEKNATAPKLKKAISNHTKQTQNHIKRLESCFKAMGKNARGKKCDAMQGLLEEAKGIMKETKAGAVRDAGIILASQKIEHYEIASYGTLAAFAKVLKKKSCLRNLLKSLKEEKKCDELLTKIADTTLNSKAVA